ncbi:hypothetical protein [Delftia acidovorans]|uniref:hypothetical protein n=1 Tax=Delftia acidovorans TaxID=80866 RepID=UPI000BDD8CA5|nr:hypothetical protein [Delftia acidovorans]SOE37597.1 hypothetical protein SAMN05216519_3647 [Delftia acidovorans]
MDHLTEQDAGLLEQAASMLEEYAEEQRTRGNDSAAEGAACSAHAIRRLAPAMLRAGHGCLAQIEESAGAAPDAVAPQDEWRIDTSTGRGILVYKNCSVIEAEQAPYVLGLIAAASKPAAVAGPVLDVRAIAAAVCQRVAELPDRNSPEDWPEAMLVTGQELIDVVTCELEQAQAAPALEAPAAPAEVGKLDAAAMPAQLSAIAAQAALDAKERHSYLPNTSAEAATWRPHFWVIQAMRAAIKFDRAINRAAAPQAPAAPAVDASDTARMDWLEKQVVNVRAPLRYGSRDLFWASPEEVDGGPDGPSDLRARIDAAQAAAKGAAS